MSLDGDGDPSARAVIRIYPTPRSTQLVGLAAVNFALAVQCLLPPTGTSTLVEAVAKTVADFAVKNTVIS